MEIVIESHDVLVGAQLANSSYNSQLVNLRLMIVITFPHVLRNHLDSHLIDRISSRATRIDLATGTATQEAQLDEPIHTQQCRSVGKVAIVQGHPHDGKSLATMQISVTNSIPTYAIDLQPEGVRELA